MLFGLTGNPLVFRLLTALLLLAGVAAAGSTLADDGELKACVADYDTYASHHGWRVSKISGYRAERRAAEAALESAEALPAVDDPGTDADEVAVRTAAIARATARRAAAWSNFVDDDGFPDTPPGNRIRSELIDRDAWEAEQSPAGGEHMQECLRPDGSVASQRVNTVTGQPVSPAFVNAPDPDEGLICLQKVNDGKDPNEYGGGNGTLYARDSSDGSQWCFAPPGHPLNPITRASQVAAPPVVAATDPPDPPDPDEGLFCLQKVNDGSNPNEHGGGNGTLYVRDSDDGSQWCFAPPDHPLNPMNA